MDPTVGSALVARYSNRLRWASVGQPVIEIPAGTRLEVTRLDGRWDHTHALILCTYRFTLHLKVLDGGSAGEMVTVTTKGEVLRVLGQDEPDSILPDWLVASSIATAG
jgi:hypothetical protein